MTNRIIRSLSKKFKNKKILIVGLGSLGGGVGLVKFFSKLGAKVIVTDLKNRDQLSHSINEIKPYNPQLILGKHRLHDFLTADFIFKGPSMPWSFPGIVEAEKRRIPIDMELSFFASYCPAKIIGITGTRGKSTVTSMIYEILKKNGYGVYLAGSLPQISTISLLSRLTANDWVVMELPSWPLSGFHRKKISPHIAVFTNFYPDHLNYYKNLNDYLWDKKAIYLYQNKSDYFIYNKNLLPVLNSRLIAGIKLPFTAADFPYNFKYLSGEHNKENAAAALQIAKIFKLETIRVVNQLKKFKGLPFRQEIVAKKNKTLFVNDTTSTTPVAAIKAIETFSKHKIFLILGGNSKNLPYDKLMDYFVKVEKIILLNGSFTNQIMSVLQSKFLSKISPVFDDLDKAVNTACFLAKKCQRKSVILFSPGATSFSMFKNEFHRGNEFNKIVKKITNGQN